MSHDGEDGQLPAEVRDAVERVASELFVGRERELAALESALREAIGGRGRVCLIAGEPGIGKTRLAECLAANATERGANVVWGRCWEGDGAPAFWPWVQVIRTCLRQGEGPTLAGRLGPGAPYVAQVVPEIRQFLPELPAAPALDSEQARFKLYDACSSFLKAATCDTPLVLVLDDLHWADKSSLLLLQFLAREIADARMLVVGTYRDVEVSREHPLADVLPRLRRERTVDRILLRGLGDDEVHALFVRLGGDDVPESFARTISRETAGNPFFIKEVLRHLLDEGVAHREGNRWVGRGNADEIQLPESVREVIGRRLARLGDACGKLLKLASVVGNEFGLDVLQRVSDFEEERVFEVLEEAAAARVVEEVPRAIGRFRFSHTLVRETLYGELRNLERVRLHRRVAEVLEGLYTRDPEPHLAELAHHFLEGLPGRDVDKAVSYAIRAGDRADEQFAHAEAAVHYGRAAQALELKEPPDERLRCEVLLKFGEAQWSAGGFEKMNEPLEEALVLAERLGSAEMFARAAVRLGGPGLGQATGDWHRLALLEKALAALDDRDSSLRAQVMSRLAALRTFAGVPEGKAALARAAIEMARRVGDGRALAYVLSATPWAGGSPDDIEDRLARADELIRLADEVGHERLAAEGHAWKACYFLEIGDIDSVDREMAIQKRFADASHQVFHRWLAMLNEGARAVLAGDLEEGKRFMQRVLEIANETEVQDAAVRVRNLGNLLLEVQGRADEILPDVLTLAGAFPQIPLWRVAAAAHRIALGQTEAARRDLEALAVDDFRHIPRDLMWLYAMTRLSEVVSFFGDTQRSALLYEWLLPYADRCVSPSLAACRGSVSRPLGLLATVLSRYDDAERHFEAALAMNARIRARIWVAHTQHDYARMLVARDRPGDRARAVALAAEALRTAREVGMKPLEAKLLDLRATAGLGDDESASRPVEAASTTARSAVFRRDGDVWTIAYEGKGLRLKDAKGVQYIAYLLRHEGRDLHAAELAAGGDGEVPHPSDASVVRGLGDAGEVLDAQARGEYRERLARASAPSSRRRRAGETPAAPPSSARRSTSSPRSSRAPSASAGGRARRATSRIVPGRP